jgi:hypothetical protein
MPHPEPLAASAALVLRWSGDLLSLAAVVAVADPTGIAAQRCWHLVEYIQVADRMSLQLAPRISRLLRF